MICIMVSSRFTSTVCPPPEWTATMVANAAAKPVTSSVKAIGGSSGAPPASPLMDEKPLIASANVAKPGRSRYGPVCPKPVTRVIVNFGFVLMSSSGIKPNASSFPGRRFSTKTSATVSIRFKVARSSLFFRSKVMARLPRLANFHHSVSPSAARHPMFRDESPAGCSTFTTSAPKSAKYLPQCGPAKIVDMSTTFKSARGGEGWVTSRSCHNQKQFTHREMMESTHWNHQRTPL